LPEAKGQVFAGNAMGGGVLLFTSNPTRNEGPFFDAFHGQKDRWQTFHVDAEDVADWQEKNGVRVPGIVTRDRIEDARALYGDGSAFFTLRVKGNFLTNETGRAIPMALIEQAAAIWPSLDAVGPLMIGYDCAGPGDGGDEHVWSIVRGLRLEPMHAKRGLDTDAAVAETLMLIQYHRREGEIPHVNVDAAGPIGSVLFARLQDIANQRQGRADAFTVYGVHAGVLLRRGSKFERVRDQLIWNAAEWLKAGGGIPRDHMLQQEMYAQVWESLPDERLRAQPKAIVRRELGRSPDRFDSWCLAVHVPSTLRDDYAHDLPAAPPRPSIYDDPLTAQGGALDAYTGGIDPYGGGL
jgi:hypothetical protein